MFWDPEGGDSILLLEQLNEVYEIIAKFMTLGKHKIYCSN